MKYYSPKILDYIRMKFRFDKKLNTENLKIQEVRWVPNFSWVEGTHCFSIGKTAACPNNILVQSSDYIACACSSGKHQGPISWWHFFTALVHAVRRGCHAMLFRNKLSYSMSICPPVARGCSDKECMPVCVNIFHSYVKKRGSNRSWIHHA
jgi:hypothetical protein